MEFSDILTLPTILNSAIFAAVIGTFIASLTQYHIHREQLRVQLFEKRYLVSVTAKEYYDLADRAFHILSDQELHEYRRRLLDILTSNQSDPLHFPRTCHYLFGRHTYSQAREFILCLTSNLKYNLYVIDNFLLSNITLSAAIHAQRKTYAQNLQYCYFGLDVLLEPHLDLKSTSSLNIVSAIVSLAARTEMYVARLEQITENRLTKRPPKIISDSIATHANGADTPKSAP